MRAVILSILLGALIQTPKAQDTLKVRPNLRNATVYFGYGAELTHEGRFSMGTGTRTILLDGVSTTVDPNSLQVSLPEGITLLAQQFRIFQAPAPPSKFQRQIDALIDSNRLLQKEIARFQNQIAIDQELLVKTGLLIESSLPKKSEQPVLAADLLRLLDVYAARIERSKLAIFQSQTQVERIQQRIQVNQEQIIRWGSEQEKPGMPSGQLFLQVMSSKQADDPVLVKVSYYTPHAGWSANYDLRVNSKENKIKLVYKASLTQSTGFDWKQVKLTLSTGTPNFGVNAPLLTPWYLQLYVPELYQHMQARSLNANANVVQSMAKEKSLREVVVEDNDKQYRLDMNVEPSNVGAFTTLSQGQLNANYEIDLPYDVPADGQVHNVNVQERSVSATLKNYAVPKLDRESYLMAEIPDWQNLDLLPGSANIIMDDTYVGKSLIDPNSTADTLNLSLGRDKRIAVKRVQIRETAPAKSGGGTNKQVFTYEITVKNNKVTPIQMLLKDQHPLSAVKEVEVSLDEGGGAEVNPETGVLTWKLDLKPGESRKFRFVYSVKYPRDKRIVNL